MEEVTNRESRPLAAVSLESNSQYGEEMGVPGFEAFLLPVLKAFADGSELISADVRSRVAGTMGLERVLSVKRLDEDTFIED